MVGRKGAICNNNRNKYEFISLEEIDPVNGIKTNLPKSGNPNNGNSEK